MRFELDPIQGAYAMSPNETAAENNRERQEFLNKCEQWGVPLSQLEEAFSSCADPFDTLSVPQYA